MPRTPSRRRIRSGLLPWRSRTAAGAAAPERHHRRSGSENHGGRAARGAAAPERRQRRSGLLLCGLLLCAAAGAEPSAAQPAPAVSLPPAIPIFPLQDVMLFPGASRPLHVFEPRYREMVADALAGDRIIGMVMLRAGYEDEYAGNPPIYDVGCAGMITNVERLPDGRYNVVLNGLTKFRIRREDRSRSYRVAEVEALPEPMTDGDRDALRGRRALLMQLLPFVAPGQEPMPDELPDEMLVNGLSQFLGMSALDRLDLLRQEGPLARAEALIGLLERGELSR